MDRRDPLLHRVLDPSVDERGSERRQSVPGHRVGGGRHSHGYILVLPGEQVEQDHGIVQEHGTPNRDRDQGRREIDVEGGGVGARRRGRGKVRGSHTGRHPYHRVKGIQSGQQLVDGRIRAPVEIPRVHEREPVGDEEPRLLLHERR